MAEWEVTLFVLPWFAVGILVGCFLSSLLDLAAMKLARWWLRRP